MAAAIKHQKFYFGTSYKIYFSQGFNAFGLIKNIT